MKTLLLIPFTIVCTSVISQTTQKLNSKDSISISNKVLKISPVELAKKTTKDTTTKNKCANKELVEILQRNKQFDHSFDPISEPE
ncbi:MAG: hypothetical protein ABJB11_05575 [Ferruginibacter sp.]